MTHANKFELATTKSEGSDELRVKTDRVRNYRWVNNRIGRAIDKS